MQQGPMWEVLKVTKNDVGAGPFYSPADHFIKLTKQGWKWVGNYFDEESKERYELFLREKNLPQRYEDMLRLYKEFKERDLEDGKTSIRAIKKEGDKIREQKLKLAGFDKHGEPLAKPAKAKLKLTTVKS
jgi:hypothetical protein